MTALPDWAARLGLQPHPEGGWYRETWHSPLTFERNALPAGYDGPRSLTDFTLDPKERKE